MITKERILEIRRNAGLSQQNFAKALNIHWRTLQNWEYGTREPDDAAVTLLKIIEKHPELLDEIHDLD